MDQLREAILETIRYGQQFGAKYNNKDIKARLITNKKYSDEEIDLKWREMKLAEVDGKNNKQFEEKIGKAKNLGKLLSEKFTNILMVGVTGGVAAGFPKENDDIDVMIVVRKDSLWMTRVGVKIRMQINKIPQRRYGVKAKKDDFCFNLWLEEDSLRLPVNRQGLKNAMDLILMKPVVNKYEIYEKFLRENKWVEKYVINGYNKLILKSNYKDLNGKPKINMLGRFINLIMFWLQYVYMKRKFTGETVDLKRAFFHPGYRK